MVEVKEWIVSHFRLAPFAKCFSSKALSELKFSHSHEIKFGSLFFSGVNRCRNRVFVVPVTRLTSRASFATSTSALRLMWTPLDSKSQTLLDRIVEKSRSQVIHETSNFQSTGLIIQSLNC